MPFSDYLEITLPENYPAKGWQLCDWKGAVVQDIPFTPHSFRLDNLGPLPSGAYVLRNATAGINLKLIKVAAH
jgi:hypothetical protein